jgi:uncharacterized phosphosugar-binding protein
MAVERLDYVAELRRCLNALEAGSAGVLLAAEWCAEAVSRGGLIHVFGAGHSHMAAEEAFHRAGGLVPVNALLVEWLMVHARQSGRLERQPGLGKLIVDGEPVEEGDVFFVVSNSGRNPVPVEVAEAAKARGARVVAIVSLQHAGAVAARSGTGVKLTDVADLVIDNHAPLGDAAITVGELKVGGISTVMALVIIQSVLVAAVRALAQMGIEPPVWKSANLDASEEWNSEQLRRLGRRVPTLLRDRLP